MTTHELTAYHDGTNEYASTNELSLCTDLHGTFFFKNKDFHTFEIASCKEICLTTTQQRVRHAEAVESFEKKKPALLMETATGTK